MNVNELEELAAGAMGDLDRGARGAARAKLAHAADESRRGGRAATAELLERLRDEWANDAVTVARAKAVATVDRLAGEVRAARRTMDSGAVRERMEAASAECRRSGLFDLAWLIAPEPTFQAARPHVCLSGAPPRLIDPALADGMIAALERAAVRGPKRIVVSGRDHGGRSVVTTLPLHKSWSVEVGTDDDGRPAIVAHDGGPWSMTVEGSSPRRIEHMLSVVDEDPSGAIDLLRRALDTDAEIVFVVLGAT